MRDPGAARSGAMSRTASSNARRQRSCPWSGPRRREPRPGSSRKYPPPGGPPRREEQKSPRSGHRPSPASPALPPSKTCASSLHRAAPSAQASTPFCACSRFSASSNTTDCGTVDHLGRDLLAAMRRQAVHEHRVGAGLRHQPLIHAVGREQIMAALIRIIRHADPGVRHHAACAAHGGRRVLADFDLSALRPRPRDQLRGRPRTSGVAMRRVKPKRTAASIQEQATLLPSPTQATTCPAIGPRCSSKVTTSAINWQGCEQSVSPLMTGTVACRASSSSFWNHPFAA